MNVEPIQEVIELWRLERITAEQCLGKILLLLLDYHKRLLKLEATPQNDD